MKKGTKHSEETRAAIAERTRQTLAGRAGRPNAFNSLRARLEEREREIEQLREELASMRAELQSVKAELSKLKVWKDRVVSAVEKHRPALQRVAEKGGPGGDMCRELLEAFAGLDKNL